MKHKLFGDTIMIRIDKNEEVIQSLKDICAQNNVRLGTISGIGAVKDITLRYFNTKTRKYEDKVFKESFEVTSFVGNITEMNGKIYLHCHITLADKHFRALGGHLLSAKVSGTFEAVISPLKGKLGRKYDKNIGLNLISF